METKGLMGIETRQNMDKLSRKECRHNFQLQTKLYRFWMTAL